MKTQSEEPVAYRALKLCRSIKLLKGVGKIATRKKPKSRWTETHEVCEVIQE